MNWKFALMKVKLASNLCDFMFKYSLLLLFICTLQMNSNFENHILINKENLQILCVDTFDCYGHCVILTYLQEVVSVYFISCIMEFSSFLKISFIHSRT
jgi:hypothetical protein